MDKILNMSNAIKSILQKTGDSTESIIPILQEISEQYGYLPADALQLVSEYTGIQLNRIISVATFYADFRLQPCGKHKIKVCIGTACHIKGAENLFEAFKKNLGIKENEDTDELKKFTVTKVACLGCCMLAPAVQIDDQIFGQIQPENTDQLIKYFISQDENKKNISIPKFDDITAEIRICLCSSCAASGSKKIYDTLVEYINEYKIHTRVREVSCSGMSYLAPLAQIVDKNELSYNYGNLTSEKIIKILNTHFKKSFLLKLHNLADNIYTCCSKIPAVDKNDCGGYLDKQVHIVTENYSQTTPADFDEYIKNNGFQAFHSILKWTADDIIEKLRKSKLRGRGGAGFPTYIKWQKIKDTAADCKYIVCNADEGDPGAFMDRMLLESFPYRVIEGMIIAAFTIKANKGIIYVREEYARAVATIATALEHCRNNGIFKHIHPEFDITVFKDAGAFVCGEETALIASLEGKRGIPKPRPPYPVERGYLNHPTLINNVETLANIPWIIRHNIEDYLKINYSKSANSGAKTFALAGKVKRPGLIEVPMGITINEIIYDIAGGALDGRTIKAAQIGGPSGGCIPASLFDLPVDFDSLNATGSIMGSGGLVVLDDEDCMVDISLYFVRFAVSESCGKCAYCRLGMSQIMQILQKICAGNGESKDIDELHNLCEKIKLGSFCGLGKTAPNPVITTLKYFYDEYEEHINGKCRAGKCKELIKFVINEKCIGCTRCAQNCGVNAIKFMPYERHFIIQEKCEKCGVCKLICPQKAVEIN